MFNKVRLHKASGVWVVAHRTPDGVTHLYFPKDWDEGLVLVNDLIVILRGVLKDRLHHTMTAGIH